MIKACKLVYYVLRGLMNVNWTKNPVNNMKVCMKEINLIHLCIMYRNRHEHKDIGSILFGPIQVRPSSYMPQKMDASHIAFLPFVFFSFVTL